MPTLREQLLAILPTVLPKDPSAALGGSGLLKRVRPMLAGDFADSSIRQTFSDLAADDGSPIARRAGQFGYYLRHATTEKAGAEGSPEGRANKGTSRDEQPEERFRAFYCRYQDLQPNVFAKHVEHVHAKKQVAGLNKWKFPDAVVLEWEPGIIDADGQGLVPELLEVRRSLGEQPFRLRSVELKVEIHPSTLREAFFQCVSNSKWAHAATLAVAGSVDDSSVSDELERLGTSYGVEVIAFGLSKDQLADLPRASKLLAMHDSDVEKLAAHVEVQRIATASFGDTLDWKHLNDLRQQSEDFVKLFQWIHNCIDEKRARSFEDWSKRQSL